MFNYAFPRRPAVNEELTEGPPPDDTTLPNEASASGSAPFVNVDIVGHKLSFINVKEEPDEPTVTEDLHGLTETEEGNLQSPLNDETFGLSPNTETDELSIQMEDLSGSILDNLPCSDDNSVEPDFNDNHAVLSPPPFVFHPIGHLLEQDIESDEEDLLLAPSLRRVAQQKLSSQTLSKVISSEKPSPVIVIAPPTKPPTRVDPSLSVLALKEEAFIPRKLRWSFYLIVAAMCVMWLSTKLFVDKQYSDNPIDEFWGRLFLTNDVDVFPSSTNLDLSPTLLYPVESPVVSPTTVVILNHQPTSILVEDSVINENLSGFVFNMLVPSFFTLDGAEMGSFLNMTYWSSSTFWFPLWIRNLVAAVCFAYATIKFIVSAIYTVFVLLPGIVCFCLLVKFLRFFSPSAKTETKKHVEFKAEHGKDTFSTTDMVISVHSLCRFLRMCKAELRRSGRRSRVAPPSDSFQHLNVYDKGLYEVLSIEDLKLIGDFLGLSGLSQLSKHKIHLIGAIIVQYESILRKLTVLELKQVLKVLKVDPYYSNKDKLLKLIVEAGF